VRDNPLKTRLAAGETAFGTMVFEFLSPGLPAVLANAGADFVIYDMEHSGFGMADMKTQFALCRGAGLTPLVRPPGKDYQFVARLLDVGAFGIMAQMVESAEEAERLVRWTRYPPAGGRGAMFGAGHDEWDFTTPMADTISTSNARTMVVALIETAKGIRNVDEILAVPGIDVGHLGHADLSLSMGIPGQFDHPDFKAAVELLLDAARRHEKAAGCLAPTVDMGRVWRAQGFRMISYKFDSMLLYGALSEGIAALKGG
jgi:2-dehydro-3-deoxyglucarate aldolase/4-hydroxy-2-oxoheptanedioate aldolase